MDNKQNIHPQMKPDERYIKPDNPDSLFSRFLQRQSHKPTELQLEKWEDEGGVVPEYNAEYGWYENDPFTKKVKLFFKRMLEKFSQNVAPKNLQTKASQHHY
ncbi:hypothetical protein [Pseudobdellovibrio sp. HCB154]|uniref:hypothetical protein n=1 Tax=Pseudobdellovibrio sp. HCB154 TaxID=3386277 RepID=UPI003916F58E